jgi:hypothetical protein
MKKKLNFDGYKKLVTKKEKYFETHTVF